MIASFFYHYGANRNDCVFCDPYNNRDMIIYTSEVVADFMDDLCDKIMDIFHDLKEDKNSFEKMGISFEEKVFYDILVRVRDTHGFEYADEKCLDLARKMKPIVDDKIQYANWSTHATIRSKLARDLSLSNIEDKLSTATRYYYSETAPTISGNYWHYDTDNQTPIKW